MSFRAHWKLTFILVLSLGVLASLMCRQSAAEEKPAAGEQRIPAVLTFQRSGGIAGFDDELVIYHDSAYVVKGQAPRKLNDAQQEALDKLLAVFGEASWSHSDGPNVADGMSQSISIRGSGKKTTLKPRDPEFRQIQQLAAELLHPSPKK